MICVLRRATKFVQGVNRYSIIILIITFTCSTNKTQHGNKTRKTRMNLASFSKKSYEYLNNEIFTCKCYPKN